MKKTLGIKNCVLVFLLVLLLLPANAAAGNADTFQELANSTVFFPAASVEGQDGSIEIYSNDAYYAYNLKLFDRLPVILSLEQDFRGISNSTGVNLPAHLIGIIPGITTYLPFFNIKNTYLGIEVYPSFYSDSWNFDASAFRVPMYYYAVYIPNDKLKLIGGIAVFPRFEDYLLPIFGFIYQPDEKWNFYMVCDNPTISYQLNAKVGFFLEYDTNIEEYIIQEPRDGNKVVQYEYSLAGAGIKLRLNQCVSAALSAGGVFDRFIKYRHHGEKADFDTGYYVSLSLKGKF